MFQLKVTSMLDFVTRPPSIIIPEFLYLGDAKTACWFPQLYSNKITHVINLSGCSNYWETKENITKFLNQQFSKEYEQSLSLEKGTDSSSENNVIVNKMIDEIIPLSYLRIDIADDPSSNISKHFHECIGFIENAKSTNGRVYVHCQAGISRSATIVVAYLMNSQKISYKRALNLVKEKRPFVKPNHGFRKQLREFEKKILLI
ncbi:protein-tyrosine phosphatase-like protein [Glomus cerebriforme]|uniref:protein-tyrosine-phosphatase n=1 Tax=Glomus cerebriforme TaxID=658196 RepID=A0A397TFP1_9GLOM|nr:protein-tyrosine phosphatase-like protein [Glomus cerebriforme]